VERADRKPSTAIALGLVLAACPCAFALNSSLDINQYAHTAWTVRDGFFKGAINAIAQTPDGYLWLGTELGLLRFDGVRAVQWAPPGAEKLPSGRISRLLAARDGTLWIGTYAGLVSWNGARLTRYPDLSSQHVLSLIEDHEGTVWAGGSAFPTGRLCAIRGGGTRCYGQDGSLGLGVGSLYEEDENLWAGAGTVLLRWRPGPPKRYPMPLAEVNDLNKSEDGQLLIAMGGGIRKLVKGRPEPYPIRGDGKAIKAQRLLRDRDGGLWIGTLDRGLLHVHQGRTDVFPRFDGLSGDLINGLFEDREGNVWVATAGGLDRFRDFTVSTVSVKQGLSTDATWSVIAARDGSVWVGSRDGLNRWKHGQITTFRKGSGLPDDTPQSLFQDDRGRVWAFTRRGLSYFEEGRFARVGAVTGGQVHSITGDHAGNLWLAEDQGLLHLRDERVVEQIPRSRLGHKEIVTNLLPAREQGGLWLGFGFSGGGVAYFEGGQTRESYSAGNGLGDGMILGLQLDSDGTLWAATEHGLSRIKDRRVTTFTSKNGLPCDTVHWTMEDDEHSFWLFTACGLMRVARAEWDRWVADPSRTMQANLFDNSDGVSLSAGSISGYGPRIAKATDGRLWFVTSGGGVQVVDPHHLPFNKLPPPLHIEEMKVDGKLWDASHEWRLPALVRDVTIRYTALSLAAPEKVHFRYKLEGQDPDWKEVVNEREAQYTNLKPRNYRFRVMASNNSGVWNEAGDFLDFSIAPAYYQTTWFLLSCVGAFFALLWMLYRYRLYQVAREFNAHMEGRVNERVRVARDLHDTLLQSFQGLMLRLQVVDEMLPPGKAKQELEETLETGDQTIVEARNAVHDLRSPTANMNDLAGALRALGQELATGHIASFRLVIEGPGRELQPIIRDEIYRIAREALRNAFAHSGAIHIEAEITFGERLFRLRIRDDGTGIPPKVLDGGRSGHFGLTGMRERAKQIGSQLTISSVPEAGTEIELSVKGSIAYNKTSGAPGWRLFHRKTG